MDIGEIANRAEDFKEVLERTKDGLAPRDFWYRYPTMGNFRILEALLSGEHRDLTRLADGKPIADIGGADGDCAFFLETLGFQAELIENPRPNFNSLEGARLLKKAFSSSVEIVEVDLDSQFALPERKYGAIFFMNVLYHLKNPYYVLEALSWRTRYCLLGTKVARYSPAEVHLGDTPVAYLLDRQELNNDPTNYWIFSPVGLRRLVSRTGWQIHDEMTLGDDVRSDPVTRDRDERMLMLIESKRGRRSGRASRTG
jgi:tRNA (mo5U34)-methyltransferase